MAFREGEVVFNEPEMYHVFQSWDGETGRFIGEKAQTLESFARITAGFDTGALINSIGTDYTRHVPSGDLIAQVGANPGGEGEGYALWHHEGTYPHEIKPWRAKALRFRQGGMVVFAQRVWHPGTQAVKYLTRWLREIV